MPYLQLFALLATTAVSGVALANDEYILTIKDHRFEPAEITIPADTRVKLIVKNLDPTPEEFESYELNREKVVAGGKDITIYIGPLDAGRYPFFGEFNKETANGAVIVK